MSFHVCKILKSAQIFACCCKMFRGAHFLWTQCRAPTPAEKPRMRCLLMKEKTNVTGPRMETHMT